MYQIVLDLPHLPSLPLTLYLAAHRCCLQTCTAPLLLVFHMSQTAEHYYIELIYLTEERCVQRQLTAA
jgi:hypothetical protein